MPKKVKLTYPWVYAAIRGMSWVKMAEVEDKFKIARASELFVSYPQLEANFTTDSYRVKQFDLMFLDMDDYENILYFENETFVVAPAWQTSYVVRAFLKKEGLPAPNFMPLPAISEEYIHDDAMKQAYNHGEKGTSLSFILSNEVEYLMLSHDLSEKSFDFKPKFLRKKKKRKDRRKRAALRYAQLKLFGENLVLNYKKREDWLAKYGYKKKIVKVPTAIQDTKWFAERVRRDFFYRPKRFEVKIKKRLKSRRYDVHDWCRTNNALSWGNYMMYSVEHHTESDNMEKTSNFLPTVIDEDHKFYLKPYSAAMKSKKPSFLKKLFYFIREEYEKPSQTTWGTDLIVKSINYVPGGIFRVVTEMRDDLTKYIRNVNMEDRAFHIAESDSEGNFQTPKRWNMYTALSNNRNVDCTNAFDYQDLLDTHEKVKEESFSEILADIWDNILHGFYNAPNMNSKSGDSYDIMPAWYNWHHITRYRGWRKGVRKKLIKAQTINLMTWLYDNKFLVFRDGFWAVWKWLFTVNFRAKFDWDRFKISWYLPFVALNNLFAFVHRHLRYIRLKLFSYYIPAAWDILVRCWCRWILYYIRRRLYLYQSKIESFFKIEYSDSNKKRVKKVFKRLKFSPKSVWKKIVKAIDDEMKGL